MRIARNDDPMRSTATGLTTVWTRTMAHLAFAAAYLSSLPEDAPWDSAVDNIAEDIRQAEGHLAGLLDQPSAFLSIEAINTSSHLASQLQEYVGLLTHDKDRTELESDLQNLMHNVSGLMAQMDRDLFGIEADSGQAL